ncbi:GNAT family N-acetyltransferase [Candidatus Woesebacteria bacterium]|nr:GNAT family N-acetyltransferase [Candidatus Woesebacteria bacterium]
MSLPANYRLREFQPGNLADIERMNLMFYHPSVMKAKAYFGKGHVVRSQADLHSVSPDMFESKSNLTRQKDNISLAVTDSSGGIVGWVWFYHDTRHPLPLAVKNRFGANNRRCHIYQVSYEKLLSGGWPKHILQKAKFVTPEYLLTERKGVIVEGLRMAILKLRREFRVLKGSKAKLVLYAFIDPSNIASSKVVEKNGFIQTDRKYSYDGDKVDLWVRIIK